jgi:hypothetical protein
MKSSVNPKIHFASANSTKPKFCKFFTFLIQHTMNFLESLFANEQLSKLTCSASALSESRSENLFDQVPNPVKQILNVSEPKIHAAFDASSADVSPSYRGFTEVMDP